MLSVKVKICGITNIDDALAAIDMGCDLLGFNFYRGSKRYVPVERALEIIDKLPTFVDTVGLFVNAEADEISDVVRQGFLNWVQLHGDETPEFCDSLSWLKTRIMKAIRVRDESDIEYASKFHTDALVLDAYHPEEYGGTGQRFDWKYVRDIRNRIFLAGGINPENAAEAVKVGVYGIDLCSGVEAEPGKKDHKKMQDLFNKINHLRMA